MHGLYAQPISYFMELLSSNNFNAVRLPLDLDFILNDREHGFILPETTHDLDKMPSPPPPYWANSSSSPPPRDEALIHLHRTQPAPPLRRKLSVDAKKEFDGRLFAFLFVALALFPGAPLMVGIVGIVEPPVKPPWHRTPTSTIKRLQLCLPRLPTVVVIDRSNT